MAWMGLSRLLRGQEGRRGVSEGAGSRGGAGPGARVCGVLGARSSLGGGCCGLQDGFRVHLPFPCAPAHAPRPAWVRPSRDPCARPGVTAPRLVGCAPHSALSPGAPELGLLRLPLSSALVS